MTTEYVDCTPTVPGYLRTLEFVIQNNPAESINAAREYGCIKTLSELGYYETDTAGVQQFRISATAGFRATDKRMKALSCLNQLGK